MHSGKSLTIGSAVSLLKPPPELNLQQIRPPLPQPLLLPLPLPPLHVGVVGHLLVGPGGKAVGGVLRRVAREGRVGRK